MEEAKAPEKVYLEPIILQTPTPHNEVLNLVKSFKVDSKFIDFKIIDIISECKLVNQQEPKILSKSELGKFNNDDFFVNELESITQSYKVEFFDIRKRPPKKIPEISISINKKLTKIIATIHKNTEVRYFEEFEKSVIDYIYKKLLKVGVIIGIRNEPMKMELSKIASILRVKELLDRDFMFVVTAGVEAIKPIDDEIVLYYKNKLNNIDKYGKIDYSKRGYVLGVVENELIAEYIKAVDGKNGRDVRGNLIKVAPPKNTITKMLEISENIEKKDDEKSIKYYAKKAGYVKDEKGVLDIREELEVSEISFRTTGSIDTKLDSNITVNITEKDITKDAIGAGMSVEANEINVDGNMAENAIIKANKVRIGGQTHSKARVEAKDAKIAVHIGYFEGDYVEIDRLEGGKVKAKNAVIKMVVGGEIIAQNLKIGILGSNSNIRVAHLTEIDELRGANNKIVVDFSLASDKNDSVEIYLQKIKDLEEQTSFISRQLNTRKTAINENRVAVNVIKQKLDEFKAAKVAPPVTFIKKLKEYQQLVHEYNTILADYKDKNTQITDMKERIQDMQDDAFEAKVINRSSWKEYNEIKFKLVNPPKEITYNTRENEIARVITLQKNEDVGGDIDYTIKKSNDL